VGGFQHPPNIDAVEFFANDIWPLYRESVPGAQAFIIGSKMPDRLRQFGEEHGLTMLGFVEDLEPYYRQCLMAIAPLRYGAGVKGKVNQALSYGLPLVGSAMSVEGMSVRDHEEVLIAESPEKFAAAMQSLHEDVELWDKLSRQGQLSLESEFSTAVARQRLQELLSDVLA
jgi:glycosyltransferase involved in cell wall biosynthesis